MAQLMRKNVLTGALAAREYIHFFRDPIGCMRTLHRKRGKLVALGPIAFGEPTKLHVLAIGPEFNRQVLGDPAKFRTTGQFIHGPKNSAQRRIRFGLTRMNGPQHKQQRQLILPPFHKKAVAGYHDLIVALAQEVIGQWRTGRRDVYADMRAVTLRIASAVLFGHEASDAYRIAHLLEVWARRNFSGPVWFFPINIPGTPYHRLLKHAERVEREILALVEKRRRDSSDRTDVLSLLIQARDDENRGMTDTELVGQATILFGASFETTASTLTWTVFLLAQHPAIIGELMDELDRVLGGNARRRDVCDPSAENFAGDHVAKIPIHRGTRRAHRSRRSHHNEPAIWHAGAINEERSPLSEQRSARSNSRDGEVAGKSVLTNFA